MQTGPNMGLVTWDLLEDFFNHAQLKANFDTIDGHNHTTGRGVQIPAGGLAPNSVTTSTLAPGAITDSSISTGSITDSRLASPPSGAYRILTSSSFLTPQGLSSGNFLLGPQYAFATGNRSSTGDFGPSVAVAQISPTALNIPNKTAKIRVTGVVGSSAVTSSTTLTFGAFSLPSLGGTGSNISFTLSTISALNSTVSNPTPSAWTQFVSGDVTLPTVDTYLGLFMLSSASLTGVLSIHSRLELHYV